MLGAMRAYQPHVFCAFLNNFYPQAAGKVSKEDFRAKLRSAAADEFSFKDYFFKEDVKSGIFMVLFICLGVASAWKLGVGDAVTN